MASKGGEAPALWAGLGGAGIIVVLLARGVSASKANWSERVGEGGGDGLSSSVVVSISSPSRHQLAADVSSLGEGWNA